MEKLLNLDYNMKEQAPGGLELAFMGDAVYEVLTREWLLSSASMRVGDLNQKKIDLVNNRAQYHAVEKISPYLTEEELAVFKRGRNATNGHIPKNAERMHYNYATGLETLFGFLYLNGDLERMRQLFLLIVNE